MEGLQQAKGAAGGRALQQDAKQERKLQEGIASVVSVMRMHAASPTAAARAQGLAQPAAVRRTFWNSLLLPATSGSAIRSCSSLNVASAVRSLSTMYDSMARTATSRRGTPPLHAKRGTAHAHCAAMGLAAARRCRRRHAAVAAVAAAGAAHAVGGERSCLMRPMAASTPGVGVACAWTWRHATACGTPADGHVARGAHCGGRQAAGGAARCSAPLRFRLRDRRRGPATAIRRDFVSLQSMPRLPEPNQAGELNARHPVPGWRLC